MLLTSSFSQASFTCGKNCKKRRPLNFICVKLLAARLCQWRAYLPQTSCPELPWDAFTESLLLLNGIFWRRWWNVVFSRRAPPVLLCPKPGCAWRTCQELSSIWHCIPALPFFPFFFHSLLTSFAVFEGVSVDQSPPRIKKKFCVQSLRLQTRSFTVKHVSVHFQQPINLVSVVAFDFTGKLFSALLPNSLGGKKGLVWLGEQMRNSFLETLEKDLM